VVVMLSVTLVDPLPAVICGGLNEHALNPGRPEQE